MSKTCLRVAAASLLAAVVAAALVASGSAFGSANGRHSSISIGAAPTTAGRGRVGPKPFDSCLSNCSFPEGPIALTVNLTDSPCDGSYSFDVDPGDGSGLITSVPITGSCDTSQNPSVFTGSGSVTHLYTDESNGALTVTFSVDDPDVGVVPASLSLTLTEGDSLVGQGQNFTVKPGVQFTKQLATFTDTPANGYTAPASDMFPTVDWGDGSPPGSTLDGTVSLSEDGETFTVTGTHTYSGQGPWLLTVKLEDDQPGTAVNQAFDQVKVRVFTATPTTDVEANSAVDYAGSGFDASGGPITIGWNDLVDPVQNTKLPAATTFNGSQTAVFGHPISDPDTACTARLTATQGPTDTVDVSGIKDAVVLAQRNFYRVVDGQGQPVKPPDYWCDGEQAGTPPGSAFDLLWDIVRAGAPSPAGNKQAEIAAQSYATDGVTVPVIARTDFGRGFNPGEVMQVAPGATVCLPLGYAQGPPGFLRLSTLYGSMTIPPSSDGPFKAGLVGSRCLSSAPHGTGTDVLSDFCDTPGIQLISPGIHTGNLVISGRVCLNGEGTRSLTVVGDLELDQAILGITGNLTVAGSVRGVGALKVDGGTTIGGSFKVESDQNAVMFAGGDFVVGSECLPCRP
jgi:hypothetical protein